MDIDKLLRKNLRNFKAYTSARDDYPGRSGVFLDANENSIGSVTKDSYNRYPDPYQNALKEKIASLKSARKEQIFLGNGSDEPIDLLYRAFCEPRLDSVILMPPTYGMYSICARINDVKIIECPLNNDFQIDYDNLKQHFSSAKLIFICSPNNPSANLMAPDTIKKILSEFEGLVIVDEAYLDFTGQAGWLQQLDMFENLVVLQTFSKAWGMAALRLGMAFANPKIIKILSKIKYPYNISELTQKTVLKALDSFSKKDKMLKEIIEGRKYLQTELPGLKIVEKVFPSDANFLLVRFKEPDKVFQKLREKEIIIRDRSALIHCENCLRITVGKKHENEIIIDALKNM